MKFLIMKVFREDFVNEFLSLEKSSKNEKDFRINIPRHCDDFVWKFQNACKKKQPNEKIRYKNGRFAHAEFKFFR